MKIFGRYFGHFKVVFLARDDKGLTRVNVNVQVFNKSKAGMVADAKLYLWSAYPEMQIQDFVGIA